MTKKQSSVEETAEKMRALLDAFIAKNGVKMAKKISSGHSGFFSYSSPTYDNRMVYSLSEMQELSRQGFFVDTDLSWIVFNAILTQ